MKRPHLWATLTEKAKDTYRYAVSVFHEPYNKAQDPTGYLTARQRFKGLVQLAGLGLVASIAIPFTALAFGVAYALSSPVEGILALADGVKSFASYISKKIKVKNKPTAEANKRKVNAAKPASQKKIKAAPAQSNTPTTTSPVSTDPNITAPNAKSIIRQASMTTSTTNAEIKPISTVTATEANANVEAPRAVPS